MREFLIAWLLVAPTDFALSGIDPLPSAKAEPGSPVTDAEMLPSRREIAGRYQIDSTHTVVSFEVRSLGIFRQSGRFGKSFGSVTLDPKTDEGTFNVVIDARTVEADSDSILRIMRGAGFLDVVRFPEIFYKAANVIFDDGEPIRVEGELTLRGITRPVPLTISGYHCIPPADSQLIRCVMEATAMFKRSQFGMTGSVAFAADRVRLAIHAEATADPAAHTERGVDRLEDGNINAQR
jgi:polyisoprenoid-binding protein YceI